MISDPGICISVNAEGWAGNELIRKASLMFIPLAPERNESAGFWPMKYPSGYHEGYLAE
jgi:hypothetical protein